MDPSIHKNVLIPSELWVVSPSESANPDGLFSMSLELRGEIIADYLFAIICSKVIAFLFHERYKNQFILTH